VSVSQWQLRELASRQAVTKPPHTNRLYGNMAAHPLEGSFVGN